MKTCLIGLDVGTTSTKAVIFNHHGEELARTVSPPYRIYTPHPGWVEQDPEELWQAVLNVLKDLISKAGDEVQVKALSIAAQSGSLLPADISGNPVYPLITWMDGRTHDLVMEWRESEIQSQVRSISGWSLYPGLCLPTIAWLRLYDEQTFAAARHYFSVNDFILHRLTGEFISNPSNGGGMQLVDIHTAQWSEPLCKLAGITTNQLSTIKPSGAIIAEILPKIATATGLSKDTILVNGGHDQGCTALGLGIIDPGKLLLACGTAWVFTGVQDCVEMDYIPATLDINFHTVSERWAVSQSLGGLGASLEWWLNQAWLSPVAKHSRGQRFDELNAEIARTRSMAGLFFIPLTGGHDDPATTRTGGFVGLQLAHSRADMARAIMESAAFELRWALDAVTAVGMPVEALSMVGGGANSPYWPSILANVTAVPIHLPEYDNWPALGAAILAGLGASLYRNTSDALRFFQKPFRLVNPEPWAVSSYDVAFKDYKQIYSAVSEFDR